MLDALIGSLRHYCRVSQRFPSKIFSELSPTFERVHLRGEILSKMQEAPKLIFDAPLSSIIELGIYRSFDHGRVRGLQSKVVADRESDVIGTRLAKLSLYNLA